MVDGGAQRRVVEQSGPGSFVTTRVLEEPSGERVVWHSRRNRKGLDPEPIHRVARTRPRHWLPLRARSITWWVAISFMVGASFFAIGSAATAFDASWASRAAPVFFVGSIFFTTASYLQLLEVVNEPHPLTGQRPQLALWRFEPEKIGWWATAVQLAGTILFNINTFDATRRLSPSAQEQLVWAPNAIGSICFLVASYLAYVEVCRRWFAWQPRNVSWWIAVVNMGGSIAFGVSAVASFVIVRSGEVLNAFQASLWTFIGAICFFVGAYLLLPEMTAHASEPAP